jgi:hypothetical protein
MPRHILMLSVRGAVVMAIAWLATAAQSAPVDSIPRLPLPSIVPGASAGTSPVVPELTVTPPGPPTEQELAAGSLSQFIAHHATTHYVTLNTTRNLARWRGGKQSICPVTGGLDPQSSAFVTGRIRALAAYVGAPVQDQPCKGNVQILFTSQPNAALEEVMQWATATGNFGIKYSGSSRNLLAYIGDHPIQGWYLTTREGALARNTDVALLGLDVLPVWPRISQKYLGTYTTGTRLGGSSGSGIGIGTVYLVVDTTKVAGLPVATVADYLAMLTLSVAQSPDNCDPLPSILDLMASSCGARERPTAITAGDLAFLKGLYFRDTGWGPSLSRASINANMMRQFNLR